MSTLPDRQPLLEVRRLRTRFETDAGPLVAVNGVSFAVRRSERLAIVGESGSGKSVTALSVLGLIDPPGSVSAERLTFGGRDLLSLAREELRRVRGGEIGLVTQDPYAALSPVFSIGEQIAETVRYHERASRRAAMARAVELLASVGIPDANVRARQYPHQFSGGMRQRAAIAIALSCDPALLIADEPTTALDVTVQAQVMELLSALSNERQMAVVLITHNLGVVAGFADEIAVMYAGRIVEQASVRNIFYQPRHPYTMALLNSQPRVDRHRGGRLEPIPGTPPNPLRLPAGCPFHPRCWLRRGRERCVREEPLLRGIGSADHRSACHFAEEVHDVSPPDPRHHDEY